MRNFILGFLCAVGMLSLMGNAIIQVQPNDIPDRDWINNLQVIFNQAQNKQFTVLFDTPTLANMTEMEQIFVYKNGALNQFVRKDGHRWYRPFLKWD